MRPKGATPEREVARIAAKQHGVVSTRQLLGMGLTNAGIRRRCEAGRLHAVHQGVYAVGHVVYSTKGRWMAAVLAAGQEGRPSFLSHRSAAELWGLLDPSRGLVDVTVFGDGGRKRRSGLRVHRSKTLTPRQTTRRKGIPVTTPRRTVHDLRQVGPRRGGANAEQLRRAIRQADILGLPVGEPLPEGTRSDIELDFLALCREGGLPPPEVNTVIGGIEVDFLWRARQVVVEVDSWRYHRGRTAFHRDHERGLKLRALGFEVIPIDETQIEQEPDTVVSVLTCRVGD